MGSHCAGWLPAESSNSDGGIRRSILTSFERKSGPPSPRVIMMLPWPWARLEWRAVCAERCTYGSGRRSAYALLTPLRTDEGWLYLAVVLDVCTRKIVGWSMDKRMKDDLVVNAFKSALHRRQPGKDFIFHSDRGSQYCSKRFKKLIKGAGGKQSMSATGSCYDNAITESFFGTLKRELVHHYRYQTRRAARRSIFSYIGAC